MSTSRNGLTITASTILTSALNAAAGAASGAIGASILTSAGYTGHGGFESTQMGAAGGAVFGGVSGLISSSLHAAGFFGKHKSSNKNYALSCCGGLAVYTGAQVINGMIGYGLMLAASQTSTEFGSVIADMATGGIVGAIPVSCGLACVLACCFMTTRTNQPESQSNPVTVNASSDKIEDVENKDKSGDELSIKMSV